MLPTIQLFDRTITMYGLMIVIGLLLGISIAVVRSKKYGLLKEDVLFASCFAGIGLLIGAKLLYIITIFPKLIAFRQLFIANPSLLVPVLTGGFVFYGGLIGALIGVMIYCKKYHIKALQMLDLLTPSIPFIHGFGRIGCFFAGCCYGIPYHGPFHLIFHSSDFAPNEVSLFPTQPLETSMNFLAFILLLIYSKPSRSSGKVLGFYVIYYAIMRFLLEYLRGDIERGMLLGLSTSQWISIALIPVGIWFILRKANTIQ